MFTTRANSTAMKIILQDKLSSIDVVRHDEERSVGIASKPEKTASASAVRRKHQREQDGKNDG